MTADERKKDFLDWRQKNAKYEMVFLTEAERLQGVMPVERNYRGRLMTGSEVIIAAGKYKSIITRVEDAIKLLEDAGELFHTGLIIYPH